jgi:hypothetical protein
LVAGVDDQQKILNEAQRVLERTFDFHDTTIQVESTGCLHVDQAGGAADLN